MSESMTKYYKRLELSSGATLDEIKEAYRLLSKVWHPDRFSNSPTLVHKANEHMKEINLAYDKLKAHVEWKNQQAAINAYAMGQGHYTERRYEKAIESFTKTIECEPAYPNVHYSMALAYHHLRRFGTAMPFLQRAKDLNPKDSGVRYAIGINFYESGSFDCAADALLECVKITPHHLAAWCKLGEIRAERGEWDSAVEMYAEAAKVAPTDVDVSICLARTYRRAGDLYAAKYWIERALEIGPKEGFIAGYMTNLCGDICRQLTRHEEEEVYRQEYDSDQT